MRKFILIPILLISFVTQSIFANDWFASTSTSELEGLWESSIVIPISQKSFPGMPESELKIDITLEYLNTAGKDIKLKIFLKLDLSKFLEDIANMPEMKATGLSKEYIWDILAQSFNNAMDNADVTIGKYFLSIKHTQQVDESFFSSNQIFFNSDRTRMLMASNVDITQGFGNETINEVIFSRR